MGYSTGVRSISGIEPTLEDALKDLNGAVPTYTIRGWLQDKTKSGLLAVVRCRNNRELHIHYFECPFRVFFLVGKWLRQRAEMQRHPVIHTAGLGVCL